MKPKPPIKQQRTDWSEVADWYDELVGESGSEFHREVVLPGVMKLLSPQAGQKILDLACGQGVLCRLLTDRAGVEATGIDASRELIETARSRGPASIRYEVADARDFSFFQENHFDAAACVLAIQNINPLSPVFAGAARVLKENGRFAIVMMHPHFRGAKETSWGWDEANKVQYRRVDRYLLPRKSPIVAHPGKSDQTHTWTFHKPLEEYAKAIRKSGLLIDAIEEWPSHKTSTSGPRAGAENTARQRDSDVHGDSSCEADAQFDEQMTQPIDYRSPSTPNARHLVGVPQQLRRREQLYLSKAGAMLLLGIPATFIGPLVLGTIFHVACVRVLERTPFSWAGWVSLLSLVMFPMLLRFEWRERGSLTNEASLDQPVDITSGTSPSATRYHGGGSGDLGGGLAGLAALTLSPRESISGFMELFLWGPRMTLDACGRLKRAQMLRSVDRSRAVEVIEILHRASDGIPTAQLLVNGEMEHSLVPVLACLTIHEWISVSKGGDRLWLRTDARRILDRAA